MQGFPAVGHTPCTQLGASTLRGELFGQHGGLQPASHQEGAHAAGPWVLDNEFVTGGADRHGLYARSVGRRARWQTGSRCR